MSQIPCVNTPTSRPSGPDLVAFSTVPSSSSSRRSFLHLQGRFTTGGGSTSKATDNPLGWGLPRSLHWNLYRCSVSRNTPQHRDAYYRTRACSVGRATQRVGSSFPTRNRISALEAWSLNHWTTREFWSPPLLLVFPPSSQNFTPNSFEFRLRWYPLKVRRRLSFPLSSQTLVILEKD